MSSRSVLGVNVKTGRRAFTLISPIIAALLYSFSPQHRRYLLYSFFKTLKSIVTGDLLFEYSKLARSKKGALVTLGRGYLWPTGPTGRNSISAK